MKIPKSFESTYSRVYPILERLEEFVKPRIQEIAAKHNAAYSGRIKTAESILIKVEKGDYELLFHEMDDLFACTLTVPNSLIINDVLTEIKAEFEVLKHRQRELKPEEFAYNDLNLSVKVKPDFAIRDELFLDLIFEVQIKTMLQQAWAQAGHAVIYKAKRKTWGLTRIASQLRALLEMADSVLANLEGTANTLQETREYAQFEQINQIVDVLENNWDEEKLPANLYRAGQTVDDYLRIARADINQLSRLVRSDNYLRYVKARTLTPTQAIFIILFQEKSDDFLSHLRRRRILLTDEMLDLCPDLEQISRENRVNLEF
jgi:ppGpp synthetase/RelA/SpoT-type nucleotidyltranferase